MSLENYEIYIADINGTRIAGPLTEVTSLEWTVGLGAIGVASLEMVASDWNDGWFNDRLVLQVWRQPRFQAAPQLIQWYWLLDYGKFNRGDVPIAFVRGLDLNELLWRRIVIGAAGSAGAVKTGDACAVMWDYADEALLTDVGRDISAEFDFTGEGLTGGESITYTASRGRLLTVLTGCANASAAAGTPVRFWVRPTETGGVLRITERPWGSDLRQAGTPFSPEFGTLYAPRWEYNSGQAETYGYIGGQGRNENRTVVEVDLSDGTPLGRREMWAENSQIVLAASLTDWGRARLHERRARLSARGELRDTELTAFGLHWSLGDVVTCEYDGRSFDGEIVAVTGKATRDGELIRARIEGDVIEDQGAEGEGGGNGGNGVE